MSSIDDDVPARRGSEHEDGTAWDSSAGECRSSHHRRRSNSSDGDLELDERRERRPPKSHRRSHRDSKHRKAKKHHRSKDEGNDKCYDSDSSSSMDDDSYDDRHRHKRHRDEKKHSKKRKDRSKYDKRKKKHKNDITHDRSNDTTTSTSPIFGQYGILKSSDMGKMQRSFEIWLSEVHGVHLNTSNVPKYELQQYFDTYREDFNTATLPHIKYYNYDKWELEEHNRLRHNEAMNYRSGSTVLEDERNHAKKLQFLAKQKEQAAMQLVAASMNSSKIADMQQQKQLQAQMQVAFKMGDSETYRKLKEKLQPPDK